MSEKLDLARSILAKWERGDFSSAEWAHPQIEYVFAEGPSPGTWKGVAGMAEGEREFLSAWEDYRLEIEQCRELDHERVLALVQHGGRGKISGIEVGQMFASGATLFDVRDGKVVRLVLYWDRDRALADLGLKE